MMRVRVGLLALLVLAAGRSAHAQVGEPGVQVSLDLLHIATRGNDVHVGDIFTERQALSGTPTDSRFDYGVRYDPIVTKMDDNRSAMVTVVFRSARWGVGARGWRSVSTGAESGGASTATPTASSQAVTGVRMWDNSIIPVSDSQHPSGISPVTYHAENSLETLRLEGFAERLWIRGDALNVAARFGVTHGRVENTRSEGQTQHAFFEETQGGATTAFENDVTLEGTSEATVNLIGPMLAVVGGASAGRLRIDWLIGQSVMLGTAETSGDWRDIDNIREVTTNGGAAVTTTTLLNGLIEKSQDDRALVPVMDLQFKASVQATRFLNVGGGVFSSTWFDLPVAPAFSVPDDWTDVQGTAWRQQTRNITFTGVSVFVGLFF